MVEIQARVVDTTSVATVNGLRNYVDKDVQLFQNLRSSGSETEKQREIEHGVRSERIRKGTLVWNRIVWSSSEFVMNYSVQSWMIVEMLHGFAYKMRELLEQAKT